MAVPANREESAARAIIEKAATRSPDADAEIPASFIEQLYGRAVPDDVVRYAPEDMATLTARAYDFMAERVAGAPKISCETVKLV